MFIKKSFFTTRLLLNIGTGSGNVQSHLRLLPEVLLRAWAGCHDLPKALAWGQTAMFSDQLHLTQSAGSDFAKQLRTGTAAHENWQSRADLKASAGAIAQPDVDGHSTATFAMVQGFSRQPSKGLSASCW